MFVCLLKMSNIYDFFFSFFLHSFVGGFEIEGFCDVIVVVVVVVVVDDVEELDGSISETFFRFGCCCDDLFVIINPTKKKNE